MLPHRNIPLSQLIRSPDVIHQNVQPALLAFDSFDECFNLILVQVIDLDRNRFAALLLDQCGRLFDRLRRFISDLCAAVERPVQ